MITGVGSPEFLRGDVVGCSPPWTDWIDSPGYYANESMKNGQRRHRKRENGGSG
jgi:hypothetical protein